MSNGNGFAGNGHKPINRRRELSEEQIRERYGSLISEMLVSIRNDPLILANMIETSRRREERVEKVRARARARAAAARRS